MRTVTYKSVLQKASALLTNKVTPNADDGVSLNLFINARYREYFERYFWPELVLVEQRTFRPAYNGTTSYAPTAEVFYRPTQSYYQSLRAAPEVSIDYDQLIAVVTSVNPHRLLTGQRVQISGAVPAQYNGTFTITVSDSNRFTYPLPSDPTTYDTGTPICGVHPADAGGQVNPAYWADAATSYSAEDWTPAAPYAVGDIVGTPDGRFCQCTLAHTNADPSDTNYWSVLTEFERNLDYEGGNQGASATMLGDVKGVWDSHPWRDDNACPIAFQLTSDGVVVRGTLPVVWVEFRIRPHEFTGTAFVPTLHYSVGDQVYYAATGEFYRCIQVVNDGELPTYTTNWVKLDFPFVLGAAVAQAAYADQLKVTGKTSKWTEEIRESLRLLQREFDKIERQQGQVGGLMVLTR